jgi:hypothetical protein
LGPLGTAATNMPIVPAPGDYDDGEIGGMIGRGNKSTRRKPVPVPPCPPQTPHAARTRTRAAAVGSQRLNRLSYGTAYGDGYFYMYPCSELFRLNAVLMCRRSCRRCRAFRYSTAFSIHINAEVLNSKTVFKMHLNRVLVDRLVCAL